MTKKLSQEKRKAMERATRVGLRIQKDRELSQYLLEWYTHTRIGYKALADAARIADWYETTSAIARLALYKALYGHARGFEIDSYAGLLGENAESIGKEKLSEAGRYQWESERGMYGRTTEQWAHDSREGGKKGAQESLKTRGISSWSDEEKALVRELIRNPKYHSSRGIQWYKMVEDFESRGYNRDWKSIQNIARRLQKQDPAQDN